jgi:hypothetical protein
MLKYPHNISRKKIGDVCMGATDNPDKEVVKSRIEEVMSRILSNKYDAKIKIKFKPKEEIEEEKKDKK